MCSSTARSAATTSSGASARRRLSTPACGRASVHAAWTDSLESVRTALDASLADDRAMLRQATTQELGPTCEAVLDDKDLIAFATLTVIAGMPRFIAIKRVDMGGRRQSRRTWVLHGMIVRREGGRGIQRRRLSAASFLPDCIFLHGARIFKTVSSPRGPVISPVPWRSQRPCSSGC